MIILSNCAACGKALGNPHDSPRCVGCRTLYCGDRCLRYDSHRGGHDDECEEKASAGGAEQYHANKKYKEALETAVEACAEAVAGQTCYICMDGDAEEGLVRGCSCRGGNGFVHLSCLVRQAQVATADAEERDLDDDAFDAKWRRWDTCGLCEQTYHGFVKCALGWACWKTYVGRPETNSTRILAISPLACGLYDAGHDEEAVTVNEARLAFLRRSDPLREEILDAQSNLANCYQEVGRLEDALSLESEVYSASLETDGEESVTAIGGAINCASILKDLGRFDESKSLLRKAMPATQRFLGEDDILTLKMKTVYAEALYGDAAATLHDLHEAVVTLEEATRTAQRVFGGAHPLVRWLKISLGNSREAFDGAAREGV